MLARAKKDGTSAHGAAECNGKYITQDEMRDIVRPYFTAVAKRAMGEE